MTELESKVFKLLFHVSSSSEVYKLYLNFFLQNLFIIKLTDEIKIKLIQEKYNILKLFLMGVGMPI